MLNRSKCDIVNYNDVYLLYACEFSVVYIMRTGYVIVCTFDCRFICSNYSGLC